MTEHKFNWKSSNSIIAVVMVVLIFIGLFWITTSILKLLTWLAPVFLVLTLIINYNIVFNFGKMLWRLLNNNPLLGIGAIILTILGFPLVTLYLFLRAVLYWRVKQVTNQSQPKFTPYEEIIDEDDESLELKEMEKSTPTSESEYDQLF